MQIYIILIVLCTTCAFISFVLNSPSIVTFASLYTASILVAASVIYRKNYEKKCLTIELFDRVKNNLQIISSLCNLESRAVHDQRDALLFERIQARLMAMSLLHEKIYMAKDYSRIQFNDYIMALTKDRTKTSDLQVQVNGLLLLPLEKAVSCAILLSEIIIAAEAFLKAETAALHQVQITVGVSSCTLQFRVFDDGVKINDTHINLIRKQAPFFSQLLPILTTQLHGTWIIEKDPEPALVISIPVLNT